MFRFYLVKDQPLKFDGAQGLVLGQFFYGPSSPKINVTFSPVNIQSTGNAQLCAQLKELMETEAYLRNPSGNSGSEQKLNLALEAEFVINMDSNILSIGNSVRNYIRVDGTKEGNMLTALKNVMDRHGLVMKVKIGIENFGTDSGLVSGIKLVTEDVGIPELTSNQPGNEGAKLYSLSEYQLGLGGSHFWIQTQPVSTYHGVLNITCMAFRKAGANLFDALPGPEVKDSPSFVRKMLKEGLNTDAKIIASDGKEIKCQKQFLEGQSDVLEAIFNPTSRSLESTTGIIKMDDMCSKSVHAFLAFLYLDDVEDAKGDSAVALDLLKAGHKYNVPKLEEKMKQIFLGKPNKWFNLDDAIQLFIFARKIPGGDTLKRRATVALKVDHSNFWGSSVCKQLFKEDPEAAMELSQYIASGGPVAGSSAGGSGTTSQKRRKVN